MYAVCVLCKAGDPHHCHQMPSVRLFIRLGLNPIIRFTEENDPMPHLVLIRTMAILAGAK